MARVAIGRRLSTLLSNSVFLLVLLQISVEAILLDEPNSVPYHSDVLPEARSFSRLLKLDVAPVSLPATDQSASPPMSAATRSPPPPPYPLYSPDDWFYFLYSPPGAPVSLGGSPPSPYTPILHYERKSSYSFSAVVAIPIIAVVAIFICSLICSHNQRGSADQQARLDSGTSSAVSAVVVLPSELGSRQANSKGLDKALVSKLPTLRFTAKESGMQGRRKECLYTCAVCITDFEEGETMRLLPACGHAFHKDCIDMWLFSHSTCPLCRLSILNHKGELPDDIHNASNLPRGAHVVVDSAPSLSQPLDHQVFSPLIKIFNRSHSSIDMSHADVARTRRLALQRSCSQPMKVSKVHPVHSLS